MELKIRPEYAALVSPLSDADYQALKESIQERGIYLPIVVNAQNEILDGHHRYKTCQELGIEPPTILRKFDDPLLEKKFVIEANLKRRHLTDFQKVELGRLLEPIERELAERRMKAGTLAPDDARGKTTEKVAEKVGLSTRTYERGKAIAEKAPEELKQQVRTGAISINAGYEQTRAAEKPARERKQRHARDVVFLHAELFGHALDTLQAARDSGAKYVALRHDGHRVLNIGNTEVA